MLNKITSLSPYVLDIMIKSPAILIFMNHEVSTTYMTREIETWLSESRVGNHRSRRPVLCPLRNCVAGVTRRDAAAEVDAQRHQHTQQLLDDLR